MGNFIKHILLLFGLVLTFSGTSKGGSSEFYATLHQQVKENHAPDNLSENKLFKFPGLQRSEQRVNAANNLPGPPSKKDSPDSLYGNSIASELMLQHSASAYIWRSKELNRSLTVRDIIFPFHYFW